MNKKLDDILRNYAAADWQHDLTVLLQLSRPYMWRLIAAVLCSLVLSGINGAIAWLVKPALDTLFVDKMANMLYLLPVGVICLFLLRGIFTFFANYLMGSIGSKMIRFIRHEIYEKLLKLPHSFFTSSSSGSIISKVLNDVDVLKNTVAFTIKDMFVEGGTVVVLAAVAIYRRWDLALISFIVIPLIVYGIASLGKRMKRTSLQTRILISKVTTILHESLQGMKIIKAFTMGREMSRRYDDTLSEHYRNSMRETRITEFSSLIAEVFGGIGIAVILFYGSSLIASGEMSASTFFSFVAAILMIYTPLKRLSRVHNNFQQARNIIDRIRSIVLQETEREGGIEKEIRGEISIKDVSFKYPDAPDFALKNIDLDIKQGEIVALVGYSGAGKSTLADIVGGFWEPTDGNVFVDGINIKELSLESLRSNLGIVTQDVVLFDNTIMANIRYGRPDASDEDVIAAAKAAFAHDFITEQPEGYSSQIGERGLKLSGGQKQRLTIARAILRNPSILILDEATSSLDIESEHHVQKALEVLMQNRTTIVIAHRLSTIQKASRIVVMDRGRIIEQGTHEELLSKNSAYKELYKMQFADKEGG
ncbi:MAG: ATP-binding cassette domain-containing protein [Nitrospiraceae bacterium]|nr:ATP-binding cassette domain-containing protein [Nitrospiraceae bacterium]